MITLAFLVYWWYLFLWEKNIEKEISNTQTKISQAQNNLDSFSDINWYDKLKYIQKLENDTQMMPWSDHIKAIMEIFDDLLAVDNSDTFNIAFSDFEISLEGIRLNWYVTNLRILYQWSNWKPWLIQRFEELDFLDDISIKTYEKSDDESLLEIIESNLNENCFAQPREYEWQNKIYWNINNNIIYEIVDNEWNIWWNCTADNESKEQDYTLVRYFESLDKTKYYKLVFTDGCAPWPCSMFDEVEIF